MVPFGGRVGAALLVTISAEHPGRIMGAPEIILKHARRQCAFIPLQAFDKQTASFILLKTFKITKVKRPRLSVSQV